MKKFKFAKLNGQGNDFVLIDSTAEEIELTPDEIKKICSRNFGVGADGVIIARKSDKADLFMDYYNSDGTLAEMCGNGIRCMAMFAYDNKLVNSDKFIIDTRAGLKKIIIDTSNTGNQGNEIEVDMGSPIFKPGKIPINIDFLNRNHDFLKNKYKDNTTSGQKTLLEKISLENPVFNYSLPVGRHNFLINCISMGNPHCVIFVDGNRDLRKIDLYDIGPKIENHIFFPNKTNVEFVKIENENEISMIVWERGCGETLACGTGACASAVAAIILNLVSNLKPVKINLKGGTLKICWSGNKKDSVFLKGTVETNFSGEYYF